MATLLEFRRVLFRSDFPDSDKIADKTIESLVDYTTMLTAYKTVLDQKTSIGSQMIDDLMDNKEIQAKIKEMEGHFEADSTYAAEMRTLLGLPDMPKGVNLKSFIDIDKEEDLQLDDYQLLIDDRPACQ